MVDERLPGGAVNPVVRVADTVRRPAPERARFVADLLLHLERCGWPGAPRFLGYDRDGNQLLTYVEGHVAWEPAQPPDVWSRASLIRVTTLVRQFHDLTAGTRLAAGDEVVCHNDLSLANTVYRPEPDGLLPVAFLDWDLAAPGRRIHDVARVCWQYVGLGPGRIAAAGAGQLMRLVCDAYGLRERADLVDTVLWWQDRCWRGIAEGAEAGCAAMARLRDSGAMDGVRDAHTWVSEHRGELERALLSSP